MGHIARRERRSRAQRLRRQATISVFFQMQAFPVASDWRATSSRAPAACPAGARFRSCCATYATRGPKTMTRAPPDRTGMSSAAMPATLPLSPPDPPRHEVHASPGSLLRPDIDPRREHAADKCLCRVASRQNRRAPSVDAPPVRTPAAACHDPPARPRSAEAGGDPPTDRCHRVPVPIAPKCPRRQSARRLVARSLVLQLRMRPSFSVCDGCDDLVLPSPS